MISITKEYSKLCRTPTPWTHVRQSDTLYTPNVGVFHEVLCGNLRLRFGCSSPLSDEIDTRFLADLLRHVASTYFFRMRGEGFLMICRVPSKESRAFRKSNFSNRSRHIHAKVLDREKSGTEILQVSGTWQGLIKEKYPHASKLIRFKTNLHHEKSQSCWE